MLHRDMGTLVSNSPWTQAGFEWTISIISAAPFLMHPTASIQPIYPVCLTFAPQPWWWRDEHAHLSHCGGTKNPDSFSQKQDSSPAADKQLVSCFIFLQAEAKMKWFNFQRVARIYRGGCERKTSWNWRQMLPSTKICPCKSPSHQIWLEALKRLQFSSIDLTLASTSPIYKLLTHPNDWQWMQSWIRHQGRKRVNNTPHILLKQQHEQNASCFTHMPNMQPCTQNILGISFLKAAETCRLILHSSFSGHIPKETEGNYSINLCLTKLRSPPAWEDVLSWAA